MGRDHWVLRQRFDGGEYSSLLGALNWYVLRWTPWRLAWRQDCATGVYVGWAFVRYRVNSWTEAIDVDDRNNHRGD